DSKVDCASQLQLASEYYCSAYELDRKNDPNSKSTLPDSKQFIALKYGDTLAQIAKTKDLPHSEALTEVACKFYGLAA
uniref:hypothetical protein n=1 Tax=Vibrio cholerae TaxID=666 RepID=UPI001F32E875